MLYFNFREDYEPSFIPSIATFSELKEDIVVDVSSPSVYDVIFIDGVMRKELNIVMEEYLLNLSLYSIAAGAVLVRNKPILLEQLTKIKRVIVSNIGEKMRDEFLSEWNFRFKGTIFENPEFYSDVTNALRSLEERVAAFAHQNYNSLIILDGPLQVIFKNVIGLIKTIKELYLERGDFLNLSKIKVGRSRSGIFVIEKPKKYSWYVRLTDGPWIYSLVRLEAFEDCFSLDQIKEIANFSAVFLPMLVTPFEKRMPQNLAPVSFLEKTLKTLLGNSDIIKNIIRGVY